MRIPAFCICKNKDADHCTAVSYGSYIVRIPAFCICKNKDADQLYSCFIWELHCENTSFLHMQKQRCRSAVQLFHMGATL